MARNVYGRHYKPWTRPGRNRHGGHYPEVTLRGPWGYHREMALEKSFHEGRNGGNNLVDYTSFKHEGVSARERKAHDALNKLLSSDIRAHCHIETFDPVSLSKERHGLVLHEQNGKV